MSSNNDTEINSIVIPALAAGIFCVAVVLISALGPASEPEELSSDQTPVLRSWRAAGSEENFARAVLAGLDLDGDGFDDVVIGAPGGPEGGHVQAFSGRTRQPIWSRVPAPEGLGGFGSSLAFQPDVDGDQIAEILVGAPREGAGSVVMLSGRTGRGSILQASGLRPGERFGASVVALDDVDGDGTHDFAAGAPGDDRRNVVGAVRIVSGADGAIITNLGSSPRLGDRFGFSLAAIRDLDGDGGAELVVGAIGEGRNGYRAGAVQVFSPRSGALLHRLDGEAANDNFGHDLDACGDRDGDSHDDFLATACNPAGRGYVLLVSGKTGQPIARYDEGERNGLGHSVSACSDLNGDGVPDLAVGAPNEPHEDLEDVGAVYVFSGRQGKLLGRLSGNREGGMFGRDIDGLRDVNDDGIPEIVVGAKHRCIATFLRHPW